MLMQYLNSFHFVEQCAISPKRYIDLSWLPRTISFRYYYYYYYYALGSGERWEGLGRTVAREKIIEDAHAGGDVVWCRM
jgi:hypothetical protein